MGKIILERTIKHKNQIEYEYNISRDLAVYFHTERRYFIEYNLNSIAMDIIKVPDGIANIPFLCNVLPIIWLTDSELVVSELDKDFYDCISEFRKGYVEMYPDANFLGKLTVGKITENDQYGSENAGIFFSAGLDAYCTLVRHLEEKPDLVALWGADVACDNYKGWEVLHKVLEEAACKYGLPLITVHTSFRKVIDTGRLSHQFNSVIHDEWWHAMQHGPAIIGHAAPIAWLRGIKKQYIASSFSPEDGYVTCCSYPTIDNFIRYNGCQTVHDGFELTRQDKVAVVVDYCNKTGDRVQLHVCWVKQDGKNCCRCEKCMRTIAELWSVGADPHEYGFEYGDDLYDYLKDYMTLRFEYNPWVKRYWIQIQHSFQKQKNKLQAMEIYKKTKWITEFDFENPEKYWKRRWNRTKMRVHRILGRVKRKILT